MTLSLAVPLLTAFLIAQSAPGVRVLVVTGGHSYPTSFYTLFEQPGLTWDHAVSSEEAFRRDLRERYDVLVLHDMPKTLSESGRGHFQAFAESGKGIVVIHHAIVSYPDWDWYRDLIGGRYLEAPAEGRPASTYRHDETMRIAVVKPHAVTEGLSAFTVLDETYKGMWLAPTNTVLLTTDNPTGDPPVTWISAYEKSRVVTIQLGHGPESHRDASYRRLIANAIRWAAAR